MSDLTKQFQNLTVDKQNIILHFKIKKSKIRLGAQAVLNSDIFETKNNRHVNFKKITHCKAHSKYDNTYCNYHMSIAKDILEK